MEEKSSFCHYPKIKLRACVKTEIRHQLAQERNSILIVPTKQQAELWSCFLELVAVFSVLPCAPEDMTEHYFSAAIRDPSSNDTSNLFFPCRSKGTVILPHFLFPALVVKRAAGINYPPFAAGDHPHLLGKVRNFTLTCPARLLAPRGLFKQ